MSTEQFHEAREETQNPVSMLDLTAVYHRHGSAEDAMESLEFVPPNTIAYVEGVRITDNFGAMSLGGVLSNLASHKREYGMDKTYHEIRDIILKDLDRKPSFIRRLKSIFKEEKKPERVRENGEFPEHECALMLGLLEKHCDIIPADYKHIGSSEDAEKYDQVSQGIKDMLAESEYTIMDKAVTTGDADQYIADMRQMFIRETVLHNVRERAAGVWVAHDVHEIMQSPGWYDRVEKTDDGKIIGSVLYGTAHAHTLTSVLREQGFSVTPHIVDPIEPWQYFDPSWKVDKLAFRAPTFYQQLTHASFRALASAVSKSHPESDAKAYIRHTRDEMYPLLAGMIGRGDEAVDFSVRCLSIRRKLDHDHSEALNDFARLVQEQRDANPTLAQQ